MNKQTKFERRTMMKKLMVLALVLGVVGFVNAGLVLNSNTQAAVESLDANPYNGWIAVDKGLTVSIEWTQAGNPNGDSKFGAGALWVDYDDGKLWSDFTVVSLNPDNRLKAGQQMLINQVSGQGYVYLYAEDGVTELAKAYLVPEPMTMGLLALGGLFIRRKK